jgi:hypothetical protein
MWNYVAPLAGAAVAGLVMLAGDLIGSGSTYATPRVGTLTGGASGTIIARNGASLAFSADETDGDVASSGNLRHLNAQKMMAFRNSAGDGDRTALESVGNSLLLGVSADASGMVDSVSIAGSSEVSLFVTSPTTPVLKVVETSVAINAGLPLRFVNGSAALPDAGLIRVPNNTTIVAARNALNSANIVLLSTNASNQAFFGPSTTFTTVLQGVDLYLATGGATRAYVSSASFRLTVALGLDNGTLTGNLAAVGDIRAQNNTTIIAARNAANDANLAILATDGSNNIYVGRLAGGGSTGNNLFLTAGGATFLDIGSGNVLTIRVNGTAAAVVGSTELQVNSNSIKMGTGASTPTITTGSGAPGSAANNGSFYLRTDGASSTTAYVRIAGNWVPLLN